MKPSLRYRLQQELWRKGVRVAILAPEASPQLLRFPVLLSNYSSQDIDRLLTDVAGRLSLKHVRSTWREDGLYCLEVPRARRQNVAFASLEPSNNATLPWLLGLSQTGKVVTVDLATAPHVLIAGTTGSGKSNGVNAAIAALVSRTSPNDVRLVLIDPKRVDLQAFADIPHTLAHVPFLEQAGEVLEHLTTEMNRRYTLFYRHKVRSIDEYNAQAKPLPRIVLVFDEAAAAMDSNKEVLEPQVLNLLQTARASGIHLVLAMQRPAGEILQPRARANLPLRVSYRLPDDFSSRLVLGDTSATTLLGNGDGVLLAADGSMTRFQSPLADREDLTRAVTQACAYPTPTWQWESVATEPAKPVIDPNASRFEQATALLPHFEDIASSDLIEYGVADSKTIAKQVLTELRAAGFIGPYDKSRKASPVIHQRVAPRRPVTNVMTSQRASQTAHVQSDQFSRTPLKEAV
jgi:S-DNA-T family DNA segregation ATPase FtsK/SpoIIIE